MRKFWMAFTVSIMVVQSVYAKCKVLSCNSFGGIDVFNASITVSENSNQCWGCGPGPNSCGNHDVVPYLNERNEIVSVWQCHNPALGTTKFVEYNPGNICSDSPIQKNSVSNSRTIYKAQGQPTRGVQVGDFNSFSGSAYCKYIECDIEYIASKSNPDLTYNDICISKYNANCILPGQSNIATGDTYDNQTCSPSRIATGLTSNNKVKSGNVCRLKCVANGWDVTLMDSACERDFEPSSDGKQCVESGAARNRRQADERARENNRRIVAQNKEICENSGGQWQAQKCHCENAKNLRVLNGKCVCLNDTEYKIASDGKSCELTDVAAFRAKCESARESGAYFEDGKCKCEDKDYIYRHDKCIENKDIIHCKAGDGTRWDYKINECVCKDSEKMEYIEDENKCIETDATRVAREAEIAAQRAKQLRQKIESISENLDSFNFEKSHWKTASGNFNGARLASDSVAGIVLGTIGGVITSNVIKKNQTKSGFEDIKCVIGGQSVADYADEFVVGQ